MEQGIWTREFLISPELCGMDGRLGVLGGLTLFQALAAEHAEQIGVGFAAMARRREFWLTVHCRIELLRPLALMDTVTGETWPEACRAESVRCFRSYRLRRGDEVFAVGRTEWAILGGAGKVVPFGQSGFPQDFPFPPWPPSSRSRAALSTISQSRVKPILCARRTSTSGGMSTTSLTSARRSAAAPPRS